MEKNNITKKYPASALIVSILILGLILSIALSLILVSIREMRSATGASRTSLAYQTADEGIESVMGEISEVNRISELSGCVSSSGLIRRGEYRVALYDGVGDDKNKISCNSTDPIERVKSIKSIGVSSNVFQQSERAIDVPVKFMSCNGENNDEQVKLLLHMDGGSDTGNFIDSAVANGVHTIVKKGGVEITKDQKKICRGAKFDGTSGYLSIADSDDWNFGSDNFTMDFWFYLKNSDIKNETFVSSWGTVNGKNAFRFEINNNSKLQFIARNQTDSADLINLTCNKNIEINRWNHATVVRDGDKAYLFLNGNKEDTDSGLNGEVFNSSVALLIGALGDSSKSNYLDGYLDEVRILKGKAQWKDNFTPSSLPY